MEIFIPYIDLVRLWYVFIGVINPFDKWWNVKN